MPGCIPMSITRLLIVALLASSPVAAQDLTGRWVYEESGQTVELQVRHDRASGRATGTFSMFGRTAPFNGVVTSGSLVVQQLGDVRASAENGTMTGRLQGGTLMFTIVQPGQSPVTLAMARRGEPSVASEPAPAAALTSASSPDAGFRSGSAGDFAGRWQLKSDDGTNEELIELTVRGTEVTGELASLEHGYFSNRTTVKARLLLRGTFANGSLQLRLWNAEGSPNDGRTATGRLRGEYLILTIAGNESGYARPGRSLVASAEGSPEGAALARAVSGRVYSTSTQAGNRGGAIVGARVRLALCNTGRIEYDVSDVGSVPDGGSIGSTTTRRGQWGVVLYAGSPVIKAQWQGTGTSYSLTAYFRVRPAASGNSANVDGVDLPLTGRC